MLHPLMPKRDLALLKSSVSHFLLFIMYGALYKQATGNFLGFFKKATAFFFTFSNENVLNLPP